MENLENLNKTEQLVQSANIIKEKSLALLKKHNVHEEVIKKQIEINKNVDNFVSSLGNIDDVSTSKFYGYLVKLCAKFQNAHLFINSKDEKEKRRYLNQHLLYLNRKVYAICKDKFFEVDKIGGQPVLKLCKDMSECISYETNEWLSVQLNKSLNSTTLYNVLDVDYSTIELKNGEKIHTDTSSTFFDYYTYFPPYSDMNDKPYDFIVIEPNIIKINYKDCSKEHKADFDKFLSEFKDKVEKENFSNYILDIRGNPGGDSEIIKPLLKFIKDKKMKGVTLTDNRVFSSGTFAAYYAKEYLNTTLIGQPLGQGNARFGQSSGKIILSEELLISYTEKYFDFSNVFNTPGVIKPDIEVPLSIEDMENRKDLSLTTAIRYLANNHIDQKETKLDRN